MNKRIVSVSDRERKLVRIPLDETLLVRRRRWRRRQAVPRVVTRLAKCKHMAGGTPGAPEAFGSLAAEDVLLPSVRLPPRPPLFPAEWLLSEEGGGCVSAAGEEALRRFSSVP